METLSFLCILKCFDLVVYETVCVYKMSYCILRVLFHFFLLFLLKFVLAMQFFLKAQPYYQRKRKFCQQTMLYERYLLRIKTIL